MSRFDITNPTESYFGGVTKIFDGGWMHIALVYLGNGAIFYYNGVESIRAGEPTVGTFVVGPGQLKVGRKYVGECSEMQTKNRPMGLVWFVPEVNSSRQDQLAWSQLFVTAFKQKLFWCLILKQEQI